MLKPQCLKFRVDYKLHCSSHITKYSSEEATLQWRAPKGSYGDEHSFRRSNMLCAIAPEQYSDSCSLFSPCLASRGMGTIGVHNWWYSHGPLGHSVQGMTWKIYINSIKQFWNRDSSWRVMATHMFLPRVLILTPPFRANQSGMEIVCWPITLTHRTSWFLSLLGQVLKQLSLAVIFIWLFINFCNLSPKPSFIFRTQMTQIGKF